MRWRPKCLRMVGLLVAIVLIGISTLSVRADAPAGRYDMLTATTLRDTATGLRWRRDFSPTVGTQSSAVSYCAGLGPGWRLPRKLELLSIVDKSRINPAIDLSAFPGTPAFPSSTRDIFWTSSSYAGAMGYAWYVAFNYGYSGRSTVGTLYSARCVR